MSEVSYGYNTYFGKDESSFYKVAVNYELKQDKYKRQSTITIKNIYIKHMNSYGQPAIGSTGSYHVGYGFDSSNRKESNQTFGLSKGETKTFNLGNVTKVFQHDLDGYVKNAKISLKFLQPDHIAGTFYMPHFNWHEISINIPRLLGTVPTMGTVSSPTKKDISETTKTITVTWNKASSYNQNCQYIVKVSIDGSQFNPVFTGGNINTTSYTYTIPNHEQGTSYVFSVGAKNDIGESVFNKSGVVTLNRVLPPTVTISNVYNPFVSPQLKLAISGGGQTIGGQVYRKAALYFNDSFLKNCNAVSLGNTSVVIDYSTNEYLKLLGNKNYQSNKFKIVSWCENQNGSKSSLTYTNFTIDINSDGQAYPTFDKPVLSGGFGNNPSTCFIKGVTNIRVDVLNAKARRALSDVTLSYDIQIYEENVSSKLNYLNFIPKQSGDMGIVVKVIDSRGLSYTKTVNIYVQDYTAPSIYDLDLSRKENSITNGLLTYKLYYSPIYSYYNSEKDKGTQINKIDSQGYALNDQYSKSIPCTSGSDVMGLDAEKNYTLFLKIADHIRPSNYIYSNTRVGTMLVDLALRNTGVGINCIPDSKYRFEVNGNSHIKGSLFINDISFKGLATFSENGLMSFEDKKEIDRLRTMLNLMLDDLNIMNNRLLALEKK